MSTPPRSITDTPVSSPAALDAEPPSAPSTTPLLTQADLDWLGHASLASHALRAAQTPPMFAETILLTPGDSTPIALAGCFTLSAAPDNKTQATQPAFLYTPHGGIEKFANRQSLHQQIGERLQDPTQRDELFRCLSIAQRSALNSTAEVSPSGQVIDTEVFAAQIQSIELAQALNAQTMVEELIKLPTLNSMLDRLLSEVLPDIDHRQIRVALGSGPRAQPPNAIKVTESMSLGDAVLGHFHNRGWPPGQPLDVTHPSATGPLYNARQWEKVISTTAARLIPDVIESLDRFWQASGPFHTSRRGLLRQVIHDALFSAIQLGRERGQLTDAQRRELLRLFRPSRREETLLFIETVRLWEYEPNSVELAGSLMISCDDHYLYTPSLGLQKVDSYRDFKHVLLDTPASAARKEALYNLLDLEEQNRFLRLDDPQLSGQPVALPVAESLADAIIEKQRKNLRYALEMSRQGDVDIHSLIDKALDIRALIGKRLLAQQTAGHWGTQPAFNGHLRPSNYLADQLDRKAKSYADIEDTFDSLFARLPLANSLALRGGLRNLLAQLTNVFSLGIRAEAELSALNGTMPKAAQDLIESVFSFDADYPDRTARTAVRGFRPDVYALTLSCSDQGKTFSAALASCFLLTERGGLDTPYSGMAILWTPAEGLQVFSGVDSAREQLNRSLMDSRKRFALLANLTPTQRKPHARYRLATFELIDDNVLLNRMKAFNSAMEAEYNYRSLLQTPDWQLDGPSLTQSLEALRTQGAPTNLARATAIARAHRWKQKLPAWLGTATVEEQRLHVELLGQYENSVADGKDYLDGIEPLRTYVFNRLKALLNTRHGDKHLDPDTVQITPHLAVVGPASSLTDFALHHLDVTRIPGFKVSSTAAKKLPASLDEAAVRRILLSLDIATTYQKQVTDKLTGTTEEVLQRKQRYRRQLPWQLLQQAHARQLQQYLSPRAFDLIRQVLDMPDGVARHTVPGASAVIYPVELVKTDGAAAVKALGLYLISSNVASEPLQVLYAPYHEGHHFIEFKDPASVIAAFNTPGALQALLIRRLPDAEQATFTHLFSATLGRLSEITLACNPVHANVLDTLFDDNALLLSQLLSAQIHEKRQFDWATALHLFSTGVRMVVRQLPGKLTFIETLWDSYQDFKASADALQAHEWKAGLQNFISGAAQMVSLGMLNRDDTFGLLDPVMPTPQSATVAPHWQDIAIPSAARTGLQAFEAAGVSLVNLQKSAPDATWLQASSGKHFACVAGKVFEVARINRLWRIVHEDGDGPVVQNSPDGSGWVIDPQRQVIRYGKVMSTLAYSYSDFKAAASLNIQARGMAQIRSSYPRHASVIEQALETARFYSLNALHNLEQLDPQTGPGSRLDTFFRSFFGVDTVDASLLEKVSNAVSPICRALADPSWLLRNGQRIVIGELKHKDDRQTAFVLEPEASGKIYLTQLFFDMGLDWYKAALPESFNVDAHGQGATLIHEITHQLHDTLDIVYLDAALPFLDLIPTTTHLGQRLFDRQKDLQDKGFSAKTPRAQLFMEWDSSTNTRKSLEALPRYRHVVKDILTVTGTRNLDQARDAFLDPILPNQRIDLMLRNADSLTLLICESGRQLDPRPTRSGT